MKKQNKTKKKKLLSINSKGGCGLLQNNLDSSKIHNIRHATQRKDHLICLKVPRNKTQKIISTAVLCRHMEHSKNELHKPK